NLSINRPLSATTPGRDVSSGHSPCSKSPCKYGGTCKTLPGGSFTCLCTTESTGPLCENLVKPPYETPSFSGSSFLEIKKIKAYNKVQVIAKRYQRDGLLQLDDSEGSIGQAPGHLKSLDLRGSTYIGYVKNASRRVWENVGTAEGLVGCVRSARINGRPIDLLWPGSSHVVRAEHITDCASSPCYKLPCLNQGSCRPKGRRGIQMYLRNRVLRTKEKIKLKTWQVVRVRRRNRKGLLQLGKGKKVRGKSGPKLTQLNLDLPLFLGGHKNYSECHPESGVTEGFSGAIQRLVINEDILENLDEKAVGGKNVKRYRGPPCSHNPCQNGGICHPYLNRFLCKCVSGFLGKFCEQAIDEKDLQKPVLFDGTTYMQFPNTIFTATTSGEGLMLWMSKGSSLQKDYLSLALSRGLKLTMENGTKLWCIEGRGSVFYE
ncbi:Pikachurin, partial [Armadillidium nasatum]